MPKIIDRINLCKKLLDSSYKTSAIGFCNRIDVFVEHNYFL